jgi:hypothetical protein
MGDAVKIQSNAFAGRARVDIYGQGAPQGGFCKRQLCLVSYAEKVAIAPDCKFVQSTPFRLACMSKLRSDVKTPIYAAQYAICKSL